MWLLCDQYVITMWFRPHPWSICRLELLVRLVPLPPITYNFYLRKLRFLRKVRKSMSFKMILNSHNSLFAHIFFNSHFIRYQRLKEQGASSYGLSTDAFSALLKSPQKFISSSFLPENQYSILNYSAWRKWRLWRNGGEVSAISATFAISATCRFLSLTKVFYITVIAVFISFFFWGGMCA